jgi:hypothetical protein
MSGYFKYCQIVLRITLKETRRLLKQRRKGGRVLVLWILEEDR